MSLGIDIGTCWSSAAVVIGGEPRPVKDPHRHTYTVPSVACWDAEAKALLVGEAAEFAGRDRPERIVREFKRDVGKGTEYHLGRDRPVVTGEVLSAFIRQFVAEAAAITSEGARPTAAVLSVPAHWEGHTRGAVIAAAREAGIEPHLLSEPIAAALYHEHRTRRPLPDGEPVLVYHLGGGAFDAALLTKRAGRFDEPVPCRRFDEVGGGAIDALIFRDLLAAAPPELRARLSAPGALRTAVGGECRRLKHHLSRAPRGAFRPDPERTDWEYALDTTRFEALIRPHLDATVKLCRELLAEAGVAAPGRVLLTGGGARIPLVGRVLAEAFGRAPEVIDDPELAVCQGAALHAARVCPDPTLGDPDLAAAVRAVEVERRRLEEEAKKKPFVFLLAGRTGVGKSSTINSLLGRKVAPVGDYEPTTAEVKAYPVQMGPVGFNVVDTPGLCDGKVTDEMEYPRRMAKEAPTIHSLWFVSPLSDTRLRIDETKAIEMITRAFGPNVWKHAVIVFTCADLVRPVERYPEALTERGNLIREAIAAHAGAEVAADIPTVAVDNFSTETPDGRTWKGVLYATVFRRVAKDGLLTFALGTEFQVRVVDSAPAGGRVRRGSRFSALAALPGGDDEEFEDEALPATKEDAVRNAPIEIDRQTAGELQTRARETIIDSCTSKGGSIGESVGRFFGAPSTGRSVGAAIGRAVGTVLSWFGW